MDIFTLYALLNAIQPDFEKKNRALLNKIKNLIIHRKEYDVVTCMVVGCETGNCTYSFEWFCYPFFENCEAFSEFKKTNIQTFQLIHTKIHISAHIPADQTHKPKAWMQKKAWSRKLGLFAIYLKIVCGMYFMCTAPAFKYHI